MKKWMNLILSVVISLAGFCQQVTYAEIDRNDLRSLQFDIIGKVGTNFLVHKVYRSDHYVTVYDQSMKQLDKVKLDFMPQRSFINSDIVTYKDYAWLIYQYQQKNIIYCMAAKIKPDGNIDGSPKELDTTQINFSANNKIYSLVVSDNKEQIGILKVNTRNDKNHIVTLVRFDKQLNFINKSRMNIPMPDRNDFLNEFVLDNSGDLAFVKLAGTNQNDNINKVNLFIKKANVDTVKFYDVKVDKVFLDDVKLKADNVNNKFIVTSFYSKTRRGNVDGLFVFAWNKNEDDPTNYATIVFSDELKAEAKSEGSVKTAFNDFFIRNIIARTDGGFILTAESVSTSTRGSTFNRWDYLYGSGFWSPIDYYYWGSPFGFNPWWRWNSPNFNNITRYYSDNIAVFSFDNKATVEWTNIIRKSQYDDNTDNYLGYGLFNTGSELHFIFNTQEKRTQLLTDQSINGDGQLSRNSTIRNLDKGYDFMPRFAKQVGSRTIIIPCQYRNYICFAKIDF